MNLDFHISLLTPPAGACHAVLVASRREPALARSEYAALCEEALDYYESGDARRRHARALLADRLNGPPATTTATGSTLEILLEQDSARGVTSDAQELETVPLVESIIDAVAVLYAADDLERVFTVRGEPDDETAATVAYHHKASGWGPTLQRLDALSILLGSCVGLARWCAPRRAVTLDVVYPHHVYVQSHPDWPLDVDLARAVAYREADGAWCAYVRPALDGLADDEDAPDGGRLVRYRQGGPWPLPEPGASTVVEDGPNPLVEAGGLEGGRLIWHPLVWYWSRRPIETLLVPPASDLVAAAREVDVTLSWLAYLANLQSHGQPVQRGGGAVQQVGPMSVIMIDDPSGGFSYESPGANLGALVELVQRRIQLQALLRHLAPDMYSLQRPSIQTGPAKLIEQTGLIEARWRRTQLADQSEARLFDVLRLHHNAHGAGTGHPAIPWETTLRVRWGELRVPVDREAQVRRLAAEVALGVTSVVDATMEVYGVERDEAERHLEAFAPPADEAAPEAEGDEPVDATPIEDTATPEGGEMAAGLEAELAILESLVKLSSPPEVVQPLLRRVLQAAGVTDEAALRAAGSADLRWYTAPVEPVAGEVENGIE